VGYAFGFGPGDLSLVSSLCVILRFLLHGIRVAALNKGGSLIEYQLYQTMDHLENKPLLSE